LARTGLDEETGELHPLVIVSDNGPAYKSDRFATFIAARPELAHVRTKHRAPETNGVVERFYESLKTSTSTGSRSETARRSPTSSTPNRDLSNEVRPHGRLDCRTPLEIYLDPPGSNLFEAESVQET
jgi:putative transposase